MKNFIGFLMGSGFFGKKKKSRGKVGRIGMNNGDWGGKRLRDKRVNNRVIGKGPVRKKYDRS